MQVHASYCTNLCGTKLRSVRFKKLVQEKKLAQESMPEVQVF